MRRSRPCGPSAAKALAQLDTLILLFQLDVWSSTCRRTATRWTTSAPRNRSSVRHPRPSRTGPDARRRPDLSIKLQGGGLRGGGVRPAEGDPEATGGTELLRKPIVASRICRRRIRVEVARLRRCRFEFKYVTRFSNGGEPWFTQHTQPSMRAREVAGSFTEWPARADVDSLLWDNVGVVWDTPLGPPKSPSRPSPSRGGLRGFWMRRTPCGPIAARPSPSSTPSSNPPSSTCSATPSPIPWGGGSAV